MKKKIGVAGLVALLTLGATAPAALAQCGGQLLIKFDADVFAYEDNATLSPAQGGTQAWMSNAGSNLTVVGIITLFCDPLDNMTPDLTIPYSNEYTFVWDGLTAVAATTPSAYGLPPGVPAGNTGGTQWDTDYDPGNFYIYEDFSPDAPRAVAPGMPAGPPNGTVPVNFQDGTLILTGTITGLHTKVTRNTSLASATWGGTFSAAWQATGGSRFGLPPTDIAGGINALNGNWCGKYPSGCTPSGYTAHPDGKFDYDRPTDVQSSTWGSIKQLYR
jgi:hypothetical protein